MPKGFSCAMFYHKKKFVEIPDADKKFIQREIESVKKIKI
jgi:hypothetical protein